MNLMQDVKYGVRMLVKNPGFTLVAVLTLALGIGANTAIFSLTDQVLLRQLPVRNPDKLVIVRAVGWKTGHVDSDSEDDSTSFSYPEYKDIRDQAPAFSGLLARLGLSLNVAANGATERAKGELVSGNYFDVLSVNPALGRVFSAADDTAPGANTVAVLSYGYWARRFGKDPEILNKPVTVNGASLTIVGVAQAGFSGVQIGRDTDMFIPMSMKAQMTPGWDGMDARDDAWLNIIGRLKPAFTVKSAEAAIAPAFRSIEEAEIPILKISPGSKAEKRFLDRKIVLDTGAHGRPIFQSNAKTPLLVLLTMVGLILLIACANLASLLVARGEARQREMALRLALGAGRWRLVRQLLTESFLLALLGGVAGMIFAQWTLGVLVGSLQEGVSASGLEARLDPRVLLFALGVSIVTGILFGLGPALRATRTSLQTTLKDQGSSVSNAKSSVQLRKWLMVSQVALTTMLLASAGYFVKSLMNLEHQNLGVKVDHVVQFAVAPSLNRYTTQQTVALLDRVRQATAALPGVRGVGVVKEALFEDSEWGSNLTVQGYTPPPDEDAEVFRNSVGPDYFSAMGIPLLAGREFRESDATTSPKVVIVNERMARKYFAGRNPVGMHIVWGSHNPPVPLDIEIVGVVQNSKHNGARDQSNPFVYQPYTQDSDMRGGTFYVRTSQDPLALTGTVRQVVQGFDSNLPVFNVRTLAEQVEDSVYSDRLLTFFSISLGALAALLAAIGLYGVLAYMVARRTREIGIRMAVGATQQNVAWLILREVLQMSGIGLAIGLAAAFGLGLLIQSQLYGVKASDPLVFVGATVLLAVVAFLAAWLPARRAASVDPMVALRYE
ncbi:MAG TPA: ABC transporter permease [Candidatus Acidoferrales bacterium]|nr:ABC transporter permease [Candidatus Acidoferrales bacterium]